MADLDSNNKELLDICTTGVAGGSRQKKTPHAGTMHAWNPEDLVEYLQPLMEGLVDDLSTRKRKELTVAIFEYRDMFSSDLEDMGQID